jgi:hypothetical protein
MSFKTLSGLPASNQLSLQGSPNKMFEAANKESKKRKSTPIN